MQELVITAMAEHNADAKGCEVWLRALQRADGTEVPFECFERGDGWGIHEDDGRLFLLFNGQSPSSLQWKGECDETMQLYLGMHAWSGFVRVLWNGKEELIDLYSTEGLRVIELPVEATEVLPPKRRIQRNSALITSKPPSVWKYLNPLALIQSMYRHCDLIWQFTQREVLGRYKGSFLGLFWSFLTPLLLLSVFTFVFGMVFHGRWGRNVNGGIADFALTMFCGLIVFNVFQECMSRAPSVIVGCPNYVKRVVFPLEILPLAVLGSALIHAMISFIILVVGEALLVDNFPRTLSACYFLPLVMLPLFMFVLGLSWFLASLGVFVRDIGHAIVIIVQMLFYLTPIFYPIEALPSWAGFMVQLNPMAAMVDDAHRILMWSQPPVFQRWILVTVVSFVVMQLGYAWFMMTKRGFADVI